MPRISELPAMTVPSDSDPLAIVDSAGVITKKITRSDLLAGADLPDDTVTTDAITDGSITTAKLATASVSSEKLGATIACKAYRSSALSINGGPSKVSLDAEVFDIGSNFDTTNGRFVAPVTGYYQVNACINTQNIGDVNFVSPSIRVNGNEIATTRIQGASAGGDPGISVSDVVFVTAGQYIELYCTTAVSTSITNNALSTYMSIYFIGA